MRRSASVFATILLILVLGCAFHTAAQVNTGTLSGAVTDPQGLAVRGAKVTVTNAANGAARTLVVDDDGRYNFVGLPPGRYKMSVEGGSNFSLFENDSVIVTVGENSNLSPRLELKGVSQTVTVTSQTANIETSKTEVSQTIGERHRQSAYQRPELHQFYSHQFANHT